MKNNVSGPTQEINNIEEVDINKNEDRSDAIISLEEVGSVDGATPEVASSEEDNAEENTQTLNGKYLCYYFKTLA